MRFARNIPESAPLFDMPEGRPLRITDVQGSPELRSKLYAMGILPGTIIKICNRSCGQGSLCVRIRHCSLVIGEALAKAIVCRPAMGHGRGHDHFAHESGGACPRPDGVDIMAVRECACRGVKEHRGGKGLPFAR